MLNGNIHFALDAVTRSKEQSSIGRAAYQLGVGRFAYKASEVVAAGLVAQGAILSIDKQVIMDFWCTNDTAHKRKDAVLCIYAQAANAMYVHHIKWSFKLREMSSQSQRQHDALCRIADGDRFIIANVRTYAFVEQPERKNEIILGALDLLLDLEHDIVSTDCEYKKHEEMFDNIHNASKYNMQWLQHMLDTFDKRFIAPKSGILSCQLCGWRVQVERGKSYGNVPCEICGAEQHRVTR